ncbi:MAG: hypothetical protein WCK67_10830 [bacterium]
MLINCNKCGTLFQKRLRDICDSCLNEEKNFVEAIETYVQRSVGVFVSMHEISEGTGIDIGKITELYKKGRLSDVAARLSVKCSICGAEIKGITKKGHFCVKCYDEFKKENTKTPVKPSEGHPMLRNFDKNIVHTRKNVDADERMKFGFKKSSDE